MMICPEVDRIDQSHCRQQGGFTRAAWTQQRDDFATGNAERHVVQGNNLSLALTVNFSDTNGLNGWNFLRDVVHQASTVFGSTRIAFHIPRRLANIEINTVINASLIRSGISSMTRRGK
jgi:hypothetical protein